MVKENKMTKEFKIDENFVKAALGLSLGDEELVPEDNGPFGEQKLETKPPDSGGFVTQNTANWSLDETCQEWAANDSLWATRDVVELNLAIFANNLLEQAATIALEQRCERGTPWDLACKAIAKAIRGARSR